MRKGCKMRRKNGSDVKKEKLNPEKIDKDSTLRHLICIYVFFLTIFKTVL